MARIRQRTRGRAQRAANADGDRYKRMLALSIVLLSESENDEEELTALLIAMLALKERRAAQGRADAGRLSRTRGPRGPYNREKRQALFDLIMHVAPERWFQTWFR